MKKRALGDVFRETQIESAARAARLAAEEAAREAQRRRAALCRSISVDLSQRLALLSQTLEQAIVAAAEGRTAITSPFLPPIVMGGSRPLTLTEVQDLPAFRKLDAFCRRENIFYDASIGHESGWQDRSMGSSKIHFKIDFQKPYDAKLALGLAIARTGPAAVKPAH